MTDMKIRWSVCLALLRIICPLCVGALRPLRVNIGSVGFYRNIIPGSFPNTGPAYDMALRDVGEMYGDVLEMKHTYISKWSIMSCDPELVEHADDLMADYYYRTKDQGDLTVFVSPGCNEIGATAKLAAQWNILQLSTCSDNGFTPNRQLNPVWVSFATGSFTNIVKAMTTLIREYQWTNVFIVHETTSNPIFRGLTDVISKMLSTLPQMQLVVRKMNGTTATPKQLEALLEEFRTTSRVMVFCGHSDYLRKTLISAYSMNMTTEEYVYVGLQPLFHFGSIGNFSWRFNDSDDVVAKEAYKTVLLLGAEHFDNQTENDLVDPVINEWRNGSLNKWNFTYAEPSPYLRSSYAAIIVLAKVLYATYTSNPQFDFRNGTALANLFLGQRFDTKVMKVAIGDYGNVLVNLSLRFTDPHTHELRVVRQWDGVKERYVNVTPFIWSNGPPRNRPICGYTGDDSVCAKTVSIDIIIGVTLGVLVVVSVMVVMLTIRRIRTKEMQAILNDRTWMIEERDLTTTESAASVTSNIHGFSAYYSVMLTQKTKNKRAWHGTDVWTKEVHTLPLERSAAHNVMYEFNETFQLLIRQIKECSHPNINRFVGLYLNNIGKERFFLRALTVWTGRGSIADMIDLQHELDWMFRASFIQNALNGIRFIHSSPVKYHGSLSARKCLLDQHFTLKLSDFGYHAIVQHIEQQTKTRINEPLPLTAIHQTVEIAQAEDMHRIGKVVIEILLWQHYDEGAVTHDVPVPDNHESHQDLAVTHLDGLPAAVSILALAQSCLSQEPSFRPSAKAALQKVEDILSVTADFSGSVVDKIIRRLEAYSGKLETEVMMRTMQLVHERQKSERLLQELLPVLIVEKLRRGEHIVAEVYESITVFFSDIVGFQAVIADSTPMESLYILTHIFKVLDNAVAGFDVYKVETIGDTYMVASGVPVRNGTLHVREICLMALKMLHLFRRSTLLGKLNLWLRGGLHSGSCAAGVVGLNRPRYCLFGDTVNVASRMCSTSEADKVHLGSASTVVLAENFPDIKFTHRGVIQLKGRGEMQTSWLEQQTT